MAVPDDLPKQKVLIKLHFPLQNNLHSAGSECDECNVVANIAHGKSKVKDYLEAV